MNALAPNLLFWRLSDLSSFLHNKLITKSSKSWLMHLTLKLSSEHQNLGGRGYSMWKDEIKGLDLKHTLKVVEAQARFVHITFWFWFQWFKVSRIF